MKYFDDAIWTHLHWLPPSIFDCQLSKHPSPDDRNTIPDSDTVSCDTYRKQNPIGERNKQEEKLVNLV